jgi:hypothetical protein
LRVPESAIHRRSLVSIVPARDNYDGWTAIGIKRRRQDADCDFPDRGPIVAISPAVTAALF